MKLGSPIQKVLCCYIVFLFLDFAGFEVTELQKQVTDDPYFPKISSMNKKKNNHVFYFLAADDSPEVRKLFYYFIRSTDCLFEAIGD